METMMLATSSVQATIPYLDYHRARQFYTDKLGLTPFQETDGGTVFECGNGTSFVLYPSQFAGTAQNTAMTFVTQDIEGEVSELQARGVVFEEYDFPELKTVNGIANIPGGRVAWFKDTEGNILGVTQFG
jgi:predicted enzyme related to lactoylglutathione lyase